MVTVSQTFKLYEMVNKYLKNKEDAKAVVLSIEGIIDDRFESHKDRLATKEDLKQLELATKQDLKQLELATKQDLKQLELTTKQDLKQLELTTKQDLRQLETKMEQNFKDQLKWLIMLMFGFSTLIITLIKLL